MKCIDHDIGRRKLTTWTKCGERKGRAEVGGAGQGLGRGRICVSLIQLLAYYACPHKVKDDQLHQK